MDVIKTDSNSSNGTCELRCKSVTAVKEEKAPIDAEVFPIKYEDDEEKSWCDTPKEVELKDECEILKGRSYITQHNDHHANIYGSEPTFDFNLQKADDSNDVCDKIAHHEPFEEFTDSNSVGQAFVDNDNGETSFKCRVCDKCFTERSQLDEHSSTHSGERFKCETCGKTFTRRMSLNHHFLIHSGERPFSCDVCGKCFPVRSSLIRHLVSHSGEKRYKCDTCGNTFARQYDLTQHNITHSGDRPFDCNICGKCFTRRSLLYQHLCTHNTERPFTCNICGKSFTRRVYLLRYERTLIATHVKATA
ncbi:gastrula zinc finger protein XlCGF7.1-like isoform X7 [Periplaneta americana]|uniref:gastrula zinc finger protein XlCGF7.1-like isoform X7 n=1 Tax=Periplaneta americana TaxID=6978 RepID=UPI0037E780F6